jgi:tRNA modification GTPase
MAPSALSPDASRTTIAALASPPGGSLRAIVRLSGPRAFAIAGACCVADAPVESLPRGLFRARFHDGAQGQDAWLLCMRAPRSFTGEEVVELHLSGAAPLAEAALARVLELGGEPARPGEYARRAFEAGRLDLPRAEGILALVSAGGAAEARAALRLTGGGLSNLLDGLRGDLLDARALCEAALDFAEEDTASVDGEVVDALARRAARACEAARAMVRARPRAEGRARVVLCGAPNAGKSSLYNALAGAPAALVSPLAGTTRDPLSTRLVLGGLEAELFDTAGLRATDDPVELAAQELARAEAGTADLALWVADATLPLAEAPPLPPGAARILVWNQVDRPEAAPPPRLGALPVVATSARTGAGLDELRNAIARILGEGGGHHGAAGLDQALVTDADALERAGSAAGILRETAARQGLALDELAHELAAALEARPRGLELAAEHLARAQGALGRLGGESTAEDVLDRIFSRFCLGK